MQSQPMFRASEMLQMAIEIERSGLAFYEACAQAASDVRVREVFEFMIGEEKRHIEVFRRMKEPLAHYELPETYPGELQAYMRALIQERVFGKPEAGAQQATGVENPFQAIAMAIGFEKDSILFYSAMKQLVRPSEGEAVDQVISEEQGHIRRLVELRATLEKESPSPGTDQPD